MLLYCGNKEYILLPKSNLTIVSDVKDHSPIYIFFRNKGKDTLAEVNRKNSVITTIWILNINRRLPLRLVIPEVMKLQKKAKRNSPQKRTGRKLVFVLESLLVMIRFVLQNREPTIQLFDKKQTYQLV